MKTTPLARRSVGEELAARLRNRILRGELRPGDALREQALAEDFDTSRPSVRDALRRLAHEGLVQHETHRGARVACLQRAELKDISVARLVIEPQVARRFEADASVLHALRGLATELEDAAAADDWPAYADADLRFHTTLVGSAGSRRLAAHHLAAMRQLRLHFLSVDLDEEAGALDRRHVREHRRVVDHLASGDREAAAQVLTRHLEDALAALDAQPADAPAASG
jgi:DNA-binding GntR family transcriptional regulator